MFCVGPLAWSYVFPELLTRQLVGSFMLTTVAPRGFSCRSRNSVSIRYESPSRRFDLLKSWRQPIKLEGRTLMALRHWLP
jgi:hypothetical protein